MVGWGRRVEARVKSSHVIKTEFLSVLILKTASWFKQDWGFPGGSDGKESACSAGDPDSIPGSGRSPGEGNGNPLQHSCLENPMDGGAWSATVHGVAKSQTWLSDFCFFFSLSLGRAVKPQRRLEVIGCFEDVWLESQRALQKSFRRESGTGTEPGIWQDGGA